MNVKKEYPRLNKTLTKHFGARKAKRLITSLHNQDKENKLDMGFDDDSRLSSAVVFSETDEGGEYWYNLQKQIEPNY